MDVTAAALSGPRIRLRELRESDLADLVAWWQDPAVLITQSSGPFHPRPAESLADQFRLWSRNEGADVGFAVEHEGVLIGHVALFGATVHSRAAVYAILIGPPHQNRGLGTEATRTMLRYGFDELGLHRIGLMVNGFNERGIATYRKAGFVVEGRVREAVFRSGAWYDQVYMGILASEWRRAISGEADPA
jgi:RimJ/RimL family protein N-acetyltransferase